MFGLGLLVGLFASFFYQALSAKSTKEPAAPKSEEVAQDSDEWSDEEEESEDEQMSTDIKFLEAQGYDETMGEQYPATDVKMVLATRNDLGMGKGKIGAQCGHATLGSFN